LKKRLNILFIASWYPNKDLPFNGDFIQRHAQAVALFADVTVIHIASTIQKEKFIIEETENNQVREIRVYHKRVQTKIGLIKYIKNLFVKSKAFKIALQKAGKIDMVHLNIILPAGIFALFLKIRYKFPYIVTEHWTRFLPEAKKPFTKLERLLIKQTAQKASFLCPVSFNLKNAMLNNLHIKNEYRIISNVVDTNIFYLTNENLIFQKPIKFLHVSGMNDEHKNITGILNAVKRASLTNQNFTITFVGGDKVGEFKHYAHRIGIPEQMIDFKGVVPYSEVANIMRMHDVLLMFSNFENLPCVISEALVCGLPVVSSNVGGISEMINQNNGILVEKQNEQELADAMIQMIEKYDDYDKKQIAEAAKKQYSYEVVGKQYYDLYQEVLSLNKK